MAGSPQRKKNSRHRPGNHIPRLCRLIYSVSLCALLFVSSFLLLCGTPYPPWRHRVRGRILTYCGVCFFPSSVPSDGKGMGQSKMRGRIYPQPKMHVINFYTFAFKNFRMFVTFASLFVSNIMKALHKGALVHELYGGLPLPPGPRLRRKALLIPPVAQPAVLWHRPCCRWIFCLWFCVRRYPVRLLCIFIYVAFRLCRPVDSDFVSGWSLPFAAADARCGFLYEENHSLGKWFKRSLKAMM